MRPYRSLLEIILSVYRFAARDRSCPSTASLLETPVLDPFIEPGALVRHPEQDDWGLGQVQTVVGHRVTVNFEHAGKQLIDTSRVRLVFVSGDPRD
jgi:hypothetical protein